MTDLISCRTCKFFYMTWEQSAPNGCKAYGFKSKRLPSLVVKQESNEDCKNYSKKGQKAKTGIDLNDSSLWD